MGAVFDKFGVKVECDEFKLDSAEADDSSDGAREDVKTSTSYGWYGLRVV